MLPARFSLLVLLALVSTTSALQAVCEFQGDGTEITISGLLYGLSPGEHGFHIHESGDLSDNCQAAGGHFNPFGNNHGAPGSEDRHVGDLGNVAFDQDMITFVSIKDHLVTLTGENSVLNS